MHKRFLESMKRYLKQRKSKVQQAMKLDPDCWGKAPAVQNEKRRRSGKRIANPQKSRTPHATTRQLKLGRP